MNYTVMNQTQFDGLPILPTIDTTNGGIRLNSNISMATGARVEFDGLKFKEAVFATSWRFVVDSVDGENPRQYMGFPASSSVNDVQHCSSSKTTTSIVMSSYTVTTTSVSKLGSFFCEMGGVIKFARCASKSFRVKDSSGAIVYKWLDQVSDYKSTPPNASIVGTLVWGKAGIEANYLTASAFNSAVTAPTEPVTVIVMNASDAVGIPSVINGQPVEIKVWGEGETDVLYGGVPAYYAYRGRDPYLSFDGVDDYADIPVTNNFDVTVNCDFRQIPAGGTLLADSSSKVWFYLNAGGTEINFRITHSGGTEFFGNIGKPLPMTSLRVFRDIDNIIKYNYNSTGVTSTTKIADNIGASMRIGSRGDGYLKGKFSAFSVITNNYSYIQQGDQSQSTVLPSHPSGAGGALAGGTGWKYVGIDGHYSTNALLLNYINTTTLTAPLNIILLEPMDLSGIPAMKDGFAIIIISGYTSQVSYGSNSAFNFGVGIGF